MSTEQDGACKACDFIGPEWPGPNRDWRDWHRDTHEAERAVIRALTPVLQPLVDGLTRFMRFIGKDEA